MGNETSKPFPSECSEEVLNNMPLPVNKKKTGRISHPNYFESASLSIIDPKIKQKRSVSISESASSSIRRKEKRKRSSASESSNTSSLLSTSSGKPLTSSQHNVSAVLSTRSYLDNMKLEYEKLTNGRKYMMSQSQNIFLACDDEEADRLVILHFLLKYAFKSNLVAPGVSRLLSNIEQSEKCRPKVLEVGCGPGTWVMEMATEFPNSDFHGVDLRCMFPSSIKPQNTTFVQHDFFKDIPYPDNHFEFVRMGSMLSFLTQDQSITVLSEIHRVLKPLGYIELVDAEQRIHRPGARCENLFNQQFQQIMRKGGIDPLASQHMSTTLMTLSACDGFIDVHQHCVAIPIGWGGKIGEIQSQNMLSFLQSIHPKTKSQIIPANMEDVDTMFANAVKECQKNKSHMNWFVCYGQKPGAMTDAITKDSIPETTMELAEYQQRIALVPSTSPTSLYFDLKQNEEMLSKCNISCWDSIQDFAEGYID